ncbi:hypothetical protein PIROE2DRAFT_7821 [Piromyces sp. E2]|nr:hypothetical protein PIROE2DRAFT_7821 [Piromyces sp. E2]|eukprot:OUM65191.1 hypothetical protein PIROE2DRAFT_7821 [Piromyces sp. E2]
MNKNKVKTVLSFTKCTVNVERVAKIVNENCLKFCPYCKSGRQQLVHWCIRCPIFINNSSTGICGNEVTSVSNNKNNNGINNSNNNNYNITNNNENSNNNIHLEENSESNLI